MAWPRWRHTLEESKRLALRATDEYNSSSGRYADFVATMIRAWLYLLHAKFEQDKVDYTYKEKDGSIKLQDGEPKRWEVATCVQRHFQNQNDPARQNLELFITLRNKVEHRYEHGLSEAVGGRANALVINYQNELVSIFGDKHSLSDRLRFPIFLDSLGAAAPKSALKESQATKAARRIVARYDANLDDDVKDDNRYDYRVRLFQSTGPKSQSQAFEFVNLDSLSKEEREVLDKLGQAGKVVMKLKSVSVAAAGTMLPKAVLTQVNAQLPFELTFHSHTVLWQKLGVRPSGWTAPDGGRCDTKYCLPLPPTKSYVYTQDWITKIIDTVGTAEKYEQFFGHRPHMKKPRAA